MRARVVLCSTSGLASMKHFSIVPSDILVVAAYFFQTVFFRHVFLQPESTLDLYETKKTTARLIRTRDTCTSIYILYVYITYFEV